MEKIDFKYGVNESPKKKGELFTLSIQHVFAMFGSTILVPTLIGIDISVSLFTAGIGTLIYSQVTNKKVPVFIGSSFAYIGILTMLNNQYGANGIANAVLSVGLCYVILSIIIHFSGTNWLDKILPPIVIGPTIIVIGLSLSTVAIGNSGLAEGDFSLANAIIATSTLLAATLTILKGNTTLKTIPIIIGIVTGYIVALLIDPFTTDDIVNTSAIFTNGLFQMPEFRLPYFNYDFSFQLSIFLSVIPLVLVTISEHIGDHYVSSAMMNKNFLKDPGLSKTILGDGLATIAAGLFGGPVNTTYAENTGVIMLTRVASIKVIRLAAVFAIILAFLSPISGFINSIPISVMGGISIILFGMIAQNGIKILMNSNIDINHPRNLIISSVILVLGIGNATISFYIGDLQFMFSGMSLAALSGILLHVFLPQKDVSYKQNNT